MWYPYDAGPPERAIPWALQTYRKLEELALEPDTGVSMITLRMFSRSSVIEIPEWAVPLGAARIRSGIPAAFVSGFTLVVPLTDSSVYLDYLTRRFQGAGGVIHLNKRFAKFEEVDPVFDLVINCAGIGARHLAHDPDLEPHRGQVVIVSGVELSSAVVSDDAPLMYAIPRRSDCVFGGTNEVSDNESVDPATTASILDECSRVLEIRKPDGDPRTGRASSVSAIRCASRSWRAKRRASSDSQLRPRWGRVYVVVGLRRRSAEPRGSARKSQIPGPKSQVSLKPQETKNQRKRRTHSLFVSLVNFACRAAVLTKAGVRSSIRNPQSAICLR